MQDVVTGLTQMLPKKGNTVQSLNLKTSRSIALPIYNKVPEGPSVIQTEGDE